MLTVFSNAVSAVLTVFCVALLGYLFRRRGWVNNETAKVMPKFLTTIVIPPFLLRNITSTFEHDQLLMLLSGSIIPFITILLCFGAAVLFTHIFNISPHRRGVFKVAFATSNTMNIGLPINIALYGNVSIPYVLLYFFASVTFFWTVGNYYIAHDGREASVKLFSMSSLKKIFSPPLLGFLAGLLLVIFDVQLPSFIDKTFKYVGDMAVALGLIYVGVMMADVSFKDFKIERDIILVLLGRFVISPLSILVVVWLLGVSDGMMRNVFVIQSSLPVMLNLAVLSGYYGADAKYGTILVSVSTLLTILTVPFWTVLLGLMF